MAGATTCRPITGFNGTCGACCDPAHSLMQPRTPHTAQVLLKRVRKSGEALRRSAYTEVDLLASGSGAPPPADLGAWEGLAAGGWERVWPAPSSASTTHPRAHILAASFPLPRCSLPLGRLSGGRGGGGGARPGRRAHPACCSSRPARRGRPLPGDFQVTPRCCPAALSNMFWGRALLGGTRDAVGWAVMRCQHCATRALPDGPLYPLHACFCKPRPCSPSHAPLSACPVPALCRATQRPWRRR